METFTRDIPLTAVVWAAELPTRFRGLTRRSGVLLYGPAGWAEFCPFDNYPTPVAARWLQAGVSGAFDPWPSPQRDCVPLNLTVPACSPARALALVQASPAQTAKVKVAEPGQDIAQDCARLRAVRQGMGAQAKIRIDANAAWQVREALDSLPALERAAGGLEYVEQPCKTVAELAEVRKRSQVKVAADESIRLQTDPLEVWRAQAADVLVLKVQPLGGVRACEALYAQLAAYGEPDIVVSSALESSVGLMAGAAFAAALPRLPFACGLGTRQLLAHDVCEYPAVAAQLVPTRLKPTRAGLQACAPTDTEVAFWRKRLGECAVFLGMDPRQFSWVKPESIDSAQIAPAAAANMPAQEEEKKWV